MKKRVTRAKREPQPETLNGWAAIGSYLGVGAATAQRWARVGGQRAGPMPVRREGRYTVADIDELRAWLGKEAHMSGPAVVATTDADVSAALKASIKAARK